MKSMINKRRLVLTLIGGFFALGLIAMPSFALAVGANQAAVCDAIGAGADCSKDSSGGTDVGSVVTAVVNILSWVVGVVAVVMIIVAGFKYVTAGGDAAKVTSAKGTLMYALVGLVIAALAQTIVWFVLGKVVKK